MRITGLKSLAYVAAAIFGISVLLSAAAAPPRHPGQGATSVSTSPPQPLAPPVSLTIDPAQSKVHFTVPSTLHAVHGTFAVTRGTMNLDPASGQASGEIVVNAKSGESGSNSRDARMHREILETAKFPEVVFHPSSVEGKVTSAGGCDVKVRGTFSVHGSNHQIVAQVHAELAGDSWKGRARFDVPYVDWGIKDPSNFFLKVNHVASVEIDMNGSVQPIKESAAK
jgi:polyisoprenoid-binding protein YceI